MTEDNRPTPPASGERPQSEPKDWFAGAEQSRPEEKAGQPGDWFGDRSSAGEDAVAPGEPAALSQAGEPGMSGEAAASNEASGGEWSTGRAAQQASEAREFGQTAGQSGDGRPAGADQSGEGWFDGTRGRPSGEVPARRASGNEQGVGEGEWYGAPQGSGGVSQGEVSGRPATPENGSVGRAAGTPGEMQGSLGGPRPPGQSERQGFGMPRSEWSAGSAQPGQPTESSRSEWARPTEHTGEQVLYGSAAGQPPAGQMLGGQTMPGHLVTGPPAGQQPGGGGGTPPGSHYLLRPGSPQPPGPEPKRRGSGALVAGVATLALLVGGGAGAVGGYLASDANSSSGPVTNALDQQPPADQTSSSPSGTVEAVAEKVSPSVVQLQVQGQSAAGEGSGFIISSDGLIVTNNHVVEAAANSGKITAVFVDGSTAPAKIIGRDPTSDVAVVKADGKSRLPVVDLGSSDALKVGQGVVAIGSPFELSGTVTSGIVSSLHRPTRAGGEDGSQLTVMDAIQTDAAINPGNSGGPLVNMQGQVIGINSAIYSPQSGNGQAGSVGIGFAIPINQARRTVEEIVKTGKATQTVLGVSVRDNQDGGALVVEVVAGGAGEQAGLKPGDVVTKLDDRRIDTSDALVAAVRSHAPGDKVRLELSNGSRTVEATLAGQTVETE